MKRNRCGINVGAIKKAAKKIEEDIKKKEKELYDNPKVSFKKNENILLKYKGKEREAVVKRVNSKNYTIESEGMVFWIDKVNLTGFPKELYTEAFNVGSRKWHNENASIKKKEVK